MPYCSNPEHERNKLDLLGELHNDAELLHVLLSRSDWKSAKLVLVDLLCEVRELEEIYRKEPMPKL